MSAVINASVNKAQSKLKSFSKSADALADKSFKTGQQLIAGGLAIGAPIYKAVQAATEFETKMIDIRKQMQQDTPETVKAMTQDVMKLSKQLPVATGEIQEMIAAGLRMGIAQDKIIDYTKDVTKMSVAFDMGAGEIADNMGKIANVFKIQVAEIGDFADTINYLDDNTMAKGSELIDVLQRIGGSAKSLDKNAAAALASTMLSLGESSETAGSGISAMLNRLSAATMQSKKFQDGLGMLGINSAKLQKDMSNTATAQGAIMEVFSKIQGLKPEKQTEALVRLFGQEHGPKLQKLANNVGEFRRQLELVNGQQKGSMDKEYQKRVASSAAQMQIFKNRIQELSVKVGSALLPTLNKIVASAGKWMDKISGFIDKHPKLISGLAIAASAASGLSIAGGYLSFVVGGLAKGFSIVSKGVGIVIRVFKYLKDAFLILRIIFMAFPIVGWIMAIATAAFFIIKYWKNISAFFAGLWGRVKNVFSSTWTFLKRLFLNYTPHGLVIKHWDKITAAFSNIWGKVKAVFSGWVSWVFGLGKTFINAGANIVTSIWEGIKSMAHKPIEAVQNMVGKIRRLLPFSPAKDGPLKDIHRIKLVETIAESIKPASMINAMKKTASLALNFLTQPFQQNTVRPAAAGSGGMNVNININLSGSATQKDAEMIRAAIKKEFSALLAQHNNQKARVGFM
ncbi:phage tail tape measure protein [Foetidibacter luteolus]|uniref:phage tail tape measure protein n=1 Tax=Foetidibacter luteolus TaxID=2608880 RepID=UPI0021CF788B|nr:phage tail tape measure protein [Foetidibacter luteolus]